MDDKIVYFVTVSSSVTPSVSQVVTHKHLQGPLPAGNLCPL